MADYNTIRVDQTGSIVTLTLNKPDKMNAMGPEMVGEMLKAFDTLPGMGARALLITGEGRDQVGLLIVPGPGLAAHVAAGNDGAGAVVSEAVREALAPRLTALASKAAGSSMRVTRAIVLAEPPSMAEGEITAKGNLNFRKILTRRRALLDRLYDDADPAVIRS